MLVFCADTHLCERTWASRPTLVNDAFYSFEQIVNYAINSGAEGVVCAGDMFDVRKPPSAVLRFFRDQISKLEDKRIAFYYIQGQHDLVSPTWASTVSDWPVLLDSAGTIKLDTGFSIAGFSWTPVDQLADRLPDVYGADVAVLHQVWVEFMGDHVATEGRLADVKECNTIFTGDYHHNSILSIDNIVGDKLTVVSPGSTNLRKIDEPARKYFYTADIGSAGIEFNRMDLDTRAVTVVHVNDAADIESAAASVEKFVTANQHAVLGKPIVRVVAAATVPETYKRFNQQFSERAHLFFKIVDVCSEDDLIVDVADISNIGVKPEDFLSLFVDCQSPDFKPLQRLISAADYKQELQKLRQERLNINAT